MDLLTANKMATRQFDNRMRLVRSDQWGNRTPCTDWTVRDLVNHIVYEELWVPDLIAGKTIEEVGDAYEGDVLGDDPLAAWESASTAAIEAVRQDGALQRTVHLSFGDAPAFEYIAQVTVDLSVHAWDLAIGIGDDDNQPNDLAAEVLEIVREHQDEFSGAGSYGQPLDITACTDDLTELLARLGRARWKPLQKA